MKIEVMESSKSNSSVEAEHDKVNHEKSIDPNYTVRSME